MVLHSVSIMFWLTPSRLAVSLNMVLEERKSSRVPLRTLQASVVGSKKAYHRFPFATGAALEQQAMLIRRGGRKETSKRARGSAPATAGWVLK
jgi:hypothetical protein